MQATFPTVVFLSDVTAATFEFEPDLWGFLGFWAVSFGSFFLFCCVVKLINDFFYDDPKASRALFLGQVKYLNAFFGVMMISLFYIGHFAITHLKQGPWGAVVSGFVLWGALTLFFFVTKQVEDFADHKLDHFEQGANHAVFVKRVRFWGLIILCLVVLIVIDMFQVFGKQFLPLDNLHPPSRG